MKLKEIAEQLDAWLEEHDYEEDFDDFDELCCRIMNDNQSYFQWEVDSDTFEIDEAFDTVMGCLKEQEESGKRIADYRTQYLGDDRLFLFVEYK
jgi:hypothetical protein